MLEDAKKIISDYISAGDKIAVAVSGGADSVCLLHLVLNCVSNKENICVINFNHNIRGEESDRDSRFVRGLCDKWGVRFLGFSVDIPAMCEKSGKSAETQSREWRYETFERVKKEERVKYILTAHHQNDDAESILMHLFRGCGLNGLCGMQILSRDCYLRPLLSTTREQIEEYLKENAIEFVTDSTNTDTSYTRNFVRNELIPLIKTRWQGAESAIIELKHEATETKKCLEDLLDETQIQERDGGICLSMDVLKTDPALAPRYIIKALARTGVKADYSRINISEILALKDKRNGAKTEFLDITIYKEYESLFFIGKNKAQQSKKSMNFETASASFREGKIKIQGQSTLITSDENERNDVEKRGDYAGKILYCDISKIPPAAVVRIREDGDIFKPFGTGHKKLKSYLIDKKIPCRTRDDIPVLAHKNEILAVIGHEISDLIKLDENSKKCYIIRLKE